MTNGEKQNSDDGEERCVPQRRVYQGPIDARGAHFGTGRVIDDDQPAGEEPADRPARANRTTVTFNGPVDMTGSLVGNGDVVNHWNGDDE